MGIESPVLTSRQGSAYLGINDGKTDGLKASRSTGILWGTTAPEFIKAGKKVLYRKAVLNKFLEQFESYANNAQVK
jgi:hypothetical protein